jgi:exopolyphosphatase/guanosine-5'-triphosphate,3'-diphosphate pyrophosphatase
MLDATTNTPKLKPAPAFQPFSLGIIDLGTNSIRLDIYRIDENLGVTRLFRFKEMIRLGEDVFKTKIIKPEVIERALVSFATVKNHLREYNVNRVSAFGTCALRHSANSKEFIARVKSDTGVEISIISGVQEASLIAKAILNNEKHPNGIYALMDIGGGSTEMSLCYKNRVLDSYSFELGSIRLFQSFFETDETSAGASARIVAAKKLRLHARSVVKATMLERRWPKVKTLIGSSGTIRAVAKILKKSGKPSDPFKTESLPRVIRKMIPLSTKEMLLVPGMEEKRVDIILPGTILLDELARIFGVEDFFVTECSLRDGILDWQIENLLATGKLELAPPKVIA